MFQSWLQKKDMVGKARGFVPQVGIVTILMNDFPHLKVSIGIDVAISFNF